MNHTWIPNAEHGQICGRCDVPRFSRGRSHECGATAPVPSEEAA